MKILKLVHNIQHNHYYVMFDEIPKMTYENDGANFVGSITDDYGRIVFSEYLKYESWQGAHAFGGRELILTMKDGTIKKVKNNWFDAGYFSGHGEFINIGAGTLKTLQKCFVFCSYNINVNTFNKMLDVYFKYERIYEYEELKEWSKMQYTWYPIKIHNRIIPYMMNKYGNVVSKETKQPIYSCRINKMILKLNKIYYYFKIEFKDKDGTITKLEDSFLNVCINTLPYSKDEIINNCK